MNWFTSLPKPKSEAIKILDRILSMSKRKGSCLVSHMSLDKDSYSQISINTGFKQNKLYRTHRVIMHLLVDYDLSSELPILHDDSKCNSKSCIEFNHLRIGSISENAWDRDKKQGFGNRKGHIVTQCSLHPNAERKTNNCGRSYCLECHKLAQRKHVQNQRNKQSKSITKTRQQERG